VSSAGAPRSNSSSVVHDSANSARTSASNAISSTQTVAFPSRVAHGFIVPSRVAA